MNTYWEVEVYLHTLALDRDEWSASSPSHSIPWERTSSTYQTISFLRTVLPGVSWLVTLGYKLAASQLIRELGLLHAVYLYIFKAWCFIKQLIWYLVKQQPSFYLTIILNCLLGGDIPCEAPQISHLWNDVWHVRTTVTNLYDKFGIQEGFMLFSFCTKEGGQFIVFLLCWILLRSFVINTRILMWDLRFSQPTTMLHSITTQKTLTWIQEYCHMNSYDIQSSSCM